MDIKEYLGRSFSHLLEATPFKKWHFRRSVESDLDEIEISYVFPSKPIELICDKNERITTIFICEEQADGVTFLDFSFSLSRKELRQTLSKPSRMRDSFVDDIFGPMGAWDRFDFEDYTIHVEYELDTSCIKRVTYMTNDIVPK